MQPSDEKLDLEVIPVNHEFPDKKRASNMHLSRVRQANLNGTPIDKVLFISFHESDDEKVITQLTDALFFLQELKPDIVHVSLTYPKILQDISKLRRFIEHEYANRRVYLNLTPVQTHMHAMILRDGLSSKVYDFYPYEILDYRMDSFNFVIVPNYLELDTADWEVMGKLVDMGNKPTPLKTFLDLLDVPGWDRTITTLDQKLRRKLNNMVGRGLMDVNIGASGEKYYMLKDFALEPVVKKEE
ncbi:MAG TPA: hypothetical protein VKM55_00595 [Candidatus Lokiarchaeia archaeon]|nr:hypothetical protein [Candidatus Lokiarchaeia archaeon]